MKRYLLAGLATLFAASSANAAANLTSVTVNGLSSVSGPLVGTVWNTTVDSYYAVFVQPGFGGAVLNPNDQAINTPTFTGDNSFSIAGEGFAADPYYKITLSFADGATISGVYDKNSDADITFGTSTIVDGTRYTLTGFEWNRTRSNIVSAFTNVKGGNARDYIGQFSFVTSAVPEPASWAMMIGGFAMMGVALRSRRRQGAALSQA